LINFHENEVIKFRAVYAVNFNQERTVCRQSFTQDSLREKNWNRRSLGSVDTPSLLP